MSYDNTILWLKQKMKTEAWSALALGLLGLAGGAIILLITWIVLYAVVLNAMHGFLGCTHWSYALIPTLMLPLLFWGHATTSREYLSQYSVTTGTTSNKVVAFYLPRIGVVSNVNPLAPNTVHTMAKIITSCLYTAPRTLRWAWNSVVKAFLMGRVDVPACAAIITVLSDAGHRLSFQEIADSVEGMDPGKTFQQIHRVDGVLFLASEPAGLSLGTDLKAELAGC